MVNFMDVKRRNERMKIIAPDKREYYGLYTDPKVDRRTLPEHWHAYDIRHDDECLGIFCELCHNYVVVNSAGSFVTDQEIPELKEDNSFVNFFIDPDEWKHMHSEDINDSLMPENTPDDWDYSFID